MELNYVKSQSSVLPKAVDTTSSKTYVYLTRNVNQVYEEPKEEGEQGSTYYEFEVAKLTKAEYKLYLESEVNAATNTESQLALAELAEMIDANNTATELALAELAEAVFANKE